MGRVAGDVPRERRVLRVPAGREQRADQGRAPGDPRPSRSAAAAVPGDSQVRAALRLRRGDARQRVPKLPPAGRQMHHAFRSDLPQDVLSEGLDAFSKKLLHEGSRSMLSGVGLAVHMLTTFENIVHMEYRSHERWKTVALHIRR